MPEKPSVREFETGATRSPLQGKFQYEGFLSPLVLKRYAEYMHKHRVQVDGNIRAADNWQKGMPKDSYMDSGLRHTMDWWLHHRGHPMQADEPLEEALCALMFNTMGYLYEVLKDKHALRSAQEERRRRDLLDREPEEPGDPQDCRVSSSDNWPRGLR